MNLGKSLGEKLQKLVGSRHRNAQRLGHDGSHDDTRTNGIRSNSEWTEFRRRLPNDADHRMLADRVRCTAPASLKARRTGGGDDRTAGALFAELASRMLVPRKHG